MDYSLKRWEALSRYCEDGAVPIDNVSSTLRKPSVHPLLGNCSFFVGKSARFEF